MSNTESSADKRVIGTSERREQIIQRLRQQGSAQVNDLSLFLASPRSLFATTSPFWKSRGLLYVPMAER